MSKPVKRYKLFSTYTAMFDGRSVHTDTPFETLEALMGPNLTHYETACIFEYNVLRPCGRFNERKGAASGSGFSAFRGPKITNKKNGTLFL